MNDEIETIDKNPKSWAAWKREAERLQKIIGLKDAELLAYREAQGKVVAYYYPGNDTETEQLGFPHQLDEEQKGNCLPLYAAPQSPAVPDGWMLVPKQLTAEMRNAWDSAPYTDDDDEDMRGAYGRMIAAAPKPEVSSE